MKKEEPGILISGGGTGGHIFPALSVAGALRRACPGCRLLFIGANGRMEMTRVPAAGYDIEGLPVRGLRRPLYSLKNISVVADYVRSERKVKKIIRDFRPDAALGVGGYASCPTIAAAASKGIPCVIQEQNSYAGVTNRLLAGKVKRICVAYEGMERFFPEEKIVLTGNPVRRELLSAMEHSREEALSFFGFKNDYPVIFLTGGSLGARTLNDCMLQNMELITGANVNFIWQTGSYYKQYVASALSGKRLPDTLYINDFISDMGMAYRAADLVVSRAGACSISELCLLAKPSVLVPSPNVAEDHQTANARALTERNAALMVKDSEAREALVPLALAKVADEEGLKSLSENAGLLAKPDAADVIAREVLGLIKE